MKLTNSTNVETFINTVEKCTGNVYLKSAEGDIFNLKSSMSRYIAIGKLIAEEGKNLELFADRCEDEALLLKMLHDTPDMLCA